MSNWSVEKFLLTRPSRGVTDNSIFEFIYAIISTHTPLAGRDNNEHTIVIVGDDFYSHAPRGA